jgi:twitching motility protein PilT
MYSAIQTGRKDGMQTLDQNLKELVEKNLITAKIAMVKAVNKDMFI